MNTDAAFGILVFSYVSKIFRIRYCALDGGAFCNPGAGFYEAAEMDGAGK